MRRGFLYSKAQELGCNKIALGHHFSDVIETTLLGLFYGAQLQTMPPKLKSKNFPGMELIRPLYCIHEDHIIAWKNYNQLQFLQCACRFVEQRDKSLDGVGDSKRQEVKVMLRKLRETDPDVEKSIFNAIHTVTLDTFPGWKIHGESHSYLEEYDLWPDTFAGMRKKEHNA
jgi:tRNA(Ile)-lysidine synthase TilS/MesJ